MEKETKYSFIVEFDEMTDKQMNNNTDKIRLCISNGVLTYEITLQKFVIDCNTKEWLIEQFKEHLEEIIGNDTYVCSKEVIG